MRRIFGVISVLLLMAVSLLCTQLGATGLGDWPDAVWADWAQDTGPPVVTLTDGQQLLSLSVASANYVKTYPANLVRSDKLEARSMVSQTESTPGIQQPTTSLSGSGETDAGRMVSALWQGELPVGGRTLKNAT